MSLTNTFGALRERGEKALVAFLMAGDPSFDASLDACRGALRGGADVLELGIPFSDPMADGPAIQRAAERAIRGGMNVRRVLDLCRSLRAEFTAPIVLFGYYNPLYVFGVAAIAEEARAAGADGFLVVDLPPEEAEELHAAARARGLDLVYLLAPTSTQERIQKVRERASGFVYYVSMTGVTGAKLPDLDQVRSGVARVRAAIPLPVCVGFGVTTPGEARALAGAADGVVVGSALVRLCEGQNEGATLGSQVEASVRALKEAVRRG